MYPSPRQWAQSTFFENAAPHHEVRLVNCTGFRPQLFYQCRYVNGRMIKEQSQISQTAEL
jgi:hypothetical protein